MSQKLPARPITSVTPTILAVMVVVSQQDAQRDPFIRCVMMYGLAGRWSGWAEMFDSRF
jgi:hypothetical protein